MSNVRYYVEALGSHNLYIDYTYHHVAPAVFLAREPTDREKLDLVNSLRNHYNPKMLASHPFGCVECGKPAEQFVDRPTYALHDPAAFAVNNELIAVCQASSCRSKGRAILQLTMSKQAHKPGLASAGPEMLLCRNCFKLEKGQYQRCGRCTGPPYCSIECQKADWKRHKPDCNAHVEAMQLSSRACSA